MAIFAETESGPKSKYVVADDPLIWSALPPEGRGHYCIVTNIKTSPRHYFCTSRLEVEALIAAREAAGDEVFILTATVIEPTDRKRPNIAYKQVLSLDLDCGEEKPYRTKEEAVLATKVFLQHTGLPCPIVIDSGNGIHAHWPLDQPLELPVWEKLAVMWKSVVKHQGIKADPSVTGDSARILRPTGTTNRKGDGNKPVKLLKAAGSTTSIEQMTELLAAFLRQGDLRAKPKMIDNLDLTAGLLPSSWADALKLGDRVELSRLLLQTPTLIALADADRNRWLGIIAGIMNYLDAAPDEIVRDIIHDWSRASLKYVERDCDAAISSGLNQCNIGVVIKAAGECPEGREVIGNFKAKARGQEVLQPINIAGSDRLPSLRRLELHTSLTATPHEMSADEAVAIMNSLVVVVVNDGGVGGFYQREPSGRWSPLAKEGLTNALANKFVLIPDAEGNMKRRKVFEWWMSHPDRATVDAVLFAPDGQVPPRGRYLNLWTDPITTMASRPVRGTWRRLVCHCFVVICRRDKVLWKYVIRWMAFCVQFPGRQPGTVPILKSEREGTGKTFLCDTMAMMFGEHAMAFNTASRLTQQFNPYLEDKCFIVMSEVTLTNAAEASKAKAIISDAQLTIERKHGGTKQVDNILSIMVTTNEPWAVMAGMGARRYLVLDVDPCKAGDSAYWNALHAEREAGGTEAFLRFLLGLDLSSFDTRRDLPKTAALQDQQLRSAPPHVRWALDLADLGGGGQGIIGSIHFGHTVSSADLFRDYETWMQRGRRVGAQLSATSFGKWLASVGCKRCKVAGGQRGYHMPDADTFAAAVRREAGVYE